MFLYEKRYGSENHFSKKNEVIEYLLTSLLFNSIKIQDTNCCGHSGFFPTSFSLSIEAFFERFRASGVCVCANDAPSAEISQEFRCATSFAGVQVKYTHTMYCVAFEIQP